MKDQKDEITDSITNDLKIGTKVNIVIGGDANNYKNIIHSGTKFLKCSHLTIKQKDKTTQLSIYKAIQNILTNINNILSKDSTYNNRKKIHLVITSCDQNIKPNKLLKELQKLTLKGLANLELSVEFSKNPVKIILKLRSNLQQL